MNNYYNFYKSWIFLSASIHVALITILILSSKVAFNRPVVISNGGGKTINVDVVGFPNILKKDIAALAQKAEEPVSKPDEMKLPDAKKIKAEKKSVLEQLKASIKQEKTYLEKVKIIKGIKQSIGIGSATAKAEGTGAGDSADNMPGNPYFSTMKDLIRSYWRVPGWVKADGLNTIILVKLDQSGTAYEIAVTQPSGNADFDALAYNAVKNASPFPTPPVSLKDTLQDGVILSFP
jgi:TonB family protein